MRFGVGRGWGRGREGWGRFTVECFHSFDGFVVGAPLAADVGDGFLFKGFL